ncbi:hypothetical protein [Methanobrevibacter sp.]
MIDIRCPKCGRKLLECVGHAQISIKCPKCKNIIIVDTKTNKSDIKIA